MGHVIIKDLQLTPVDGSATEIVTVADVKTYLQIEGTAYDGPIGIFITAARQMIERATGCILLERTAVATIHNTGLGAMLLPYGPVTEVTQVRWRKCPSTWETLVLADEEYSTYGNDRVYVESVEVGLHEITYTLGVDGNVIFEQAVKAQAGYMFNNRDSDKAVTMAPEVKGLLSQYMEIS